MIAKLRLRLARWIAPKGFTLSRRLQDMPKTWNGVLVSDMEFENRMNGLSPQQVWRETRKQLVKDDHET